VWRPALGLLDLAVGISDLTDLDGIEAAFDRLRRGGGAARTVVILDPALAGAAPGAVIRPHILSWWLEEAFRGH
jgi:hypothetical protein